MTGRNWDENFGDMGTQQGAQFTRLPLAILDPWVDEDGKPQPFKPYSPEKLQELADNIKANGVIEPIRVRPRNGRFQILAGHNRVIAAGMAGLTTIPAIVEDVDDAQAAILLVDSNLQHRDRLNLVEKGKALRMRQEALKRQGKRTDLTSPQCCGEVGRSDDEAGKVAGISGDTVRRLIRLTYLIEPLQDLVDADIIKLLPAVDLSYLPTVCQSTLVRVIEEHSLKRVTNPQAKELRAAKEPDEDEILRILGLTVDEPEKIPQLALKLDLSVIPASKWKKLKKDKGMMDDLTTLLQLTLNHFLEDNVK